MNRSVVVLALIFILSILPTTVWAGEKPADTNKTTWTDIFFDIIGHYPIQSDEIGENKAGDTDTGQRPKLNQPKNWEFDLGLQRFMMSHTSYEIGNSDAPFQKPLSRLVFPMNTWWLDLGLRRTCPRWSIGLKSDFRVSREVDGRMTDEDWLNPNVPDYLTTLSESACRLDKGFLFRTDVDVNISDWLRLPSCFEIRPLFAFQFQRLSFSDHDGVQWQDGSYADDDEMSLNQYTDAQAQPNPTITFRQDYYIYQIGCKGAYNHEFNKNLTVRLYGEASWGPVVGFNEDHHMARAGNLFGYIKSSGNSYYFVTGLDFVIAKSLKLGVFMDHLGIRTYGEARHYNAPRGEDWKWTDGVKVWSDQTTLVLRSAYDF